MQPTNYAHTTTPDFTATIARLKDVATQSSNSLLLGNGPPNPDWQLLDLSAEILSLARTANQEMTRYYQLLDLHPGRLETAIERQEREALFEQWQGTEKRMKPLLRRARKLPATTPAGIYSKVLIVRSSKSGAAGLAMNLADELIRCEGLRQSLWPAPAGDVA